MGIIRCTISTNKATKAAMKATLQSPCLTFTPPECCRVMETYNGTDHANHLKTAVVRHSTLNLKSMASVVFSSSGYCISGPFPFAQQFCPISFAQHIFAQNINILIGWIIFAQHLYIILKHYKFAQQVFSQPEFAQH